MQNCRNIIFDLGGVLLNLDFKKTELAFAALGIGNFNQYYTLQTISPLFHQLEVGKIEAEDFYEGFKKIVKLPLKNDDIKDAWNALLLDFPKDRIAWLQSISKKYNIYLLSNTNKIHYEAFTQSFKTQTGLQSINSLFIKAYYSHKIHLRKPDAASFKFVLNDQKLNASETVFIDDSPLNIDGAEKVGLQTIYLPSTKKVTELDL